MLSCLGAAEAGAMIPAANSAMSVTTGMASAAVPGNNDQFGFSVALSRGVAVVGAPFAGDDNQSKFGSVTACQFHPELSGRWGLDLLRRWVDGETLPDAAEDLAAHLGDGALLLPGGPVCRSQRPGLRHWSCFDRRDIPPGG